MNHEIVSGIVNSLPIEKMVAAPLMAAVDAQSKMSGQMAQFINDVGMDKDGNIRNVTFKYNDQIQIPKVVNGEQEKDDDGNPVFEVKSVVRNIEAPFLSLTGIPNLAVDDVNISFDLEVSTAEEDKSATDSSVDVDASVKAWFFKANMKTKVAHHSEQTRRTDTRAKYSFNVSARKQGTPESLMRILETITDAVARPLDQDTVTRESNLLTA